MFAFMWPMVVVVLANILYNITTKAVPEDCSPYIMLVFAYLGAALLSLAGFYIFEPHKAIMPQITKINWTCSLLAVAMVGLEVGYIYMYRAGWEISMGSLVSNVALAVALLIIGVTFYNEKLNLMEYLGIITSIAGIVILIFARN